MNEHEYVIVNESNRVVRSFGTNLKRALDFLEAWPVGGLKLMKKVTSFEEIPHA